MAFDSATADSANTTNTAAAAGQPQTPAELTAFVKKNEAVGGGERLGQDGGTDLVCTEPPRETLFFVLAHNLPFLLFF